MKLNKYKLGELIEQRREKNNNYQYPIRGVSREGFINPKQKDADTSLYNVFYKNDFIFNPARMEINSIALNTELEKGICSSLYEIFYIKNEDILLPEYLNLFIKREEFARRCEFIGWGSAREYCRVGNISDIEIELPDIEIQKKYVAVYKSMLENQKNYERGLDDLKLVCEANIEKLRREMTLNPIGKYIKTYNEKNVGGRIKLEQGINVNKEFITPQRSNSNLEGRKIVKKGQFAYCTQLNNENVAIAYRTGEDCVVSSVYDVFEIEKKSELLPEYLMLWLSRKEFGRFVYWASEGSAYEFLNYDNLSNYLIPVPSIKSQEDIVKIYKAYILRKAINEKLKEQIKIICPILIKGSLEEAKSN